METLGQRIFRHRKANKWSQAKLAQMLGLSQGLISQWEKDLVNISTAEIKKLAQVFNIAESALFSEKPAEVAPERGPSGEDVLLGALGAFHLPKQKLSAIRAILNADEGDMLGISTACGPVLDRLAARKQDKLAR